MKVILEAFGGKLNSEPMDWPEGIGMDVRMTLDQPTPLLPNGQSSTLQDVPPLVVGRFEFTGYYRFVGRAETARIYRLVGVA